MLKEQHHLNRPDALLGLIASRHPRRFGSRIRSLGEQYDDIIGQVASLRRQLGTPVKATPTPETSATRRMDQPSNRRR